MAKGIIWNGSDHQLQINYIANAAGTGAPDLPYGQTSINDQPLTYDFASDADVTFTNIQNRHETVYITDSGSVLTGTTVINLDTVPFAKKMVANGTAQTITVQVVGGAGASVDIPAGGSALLESDGTDVVEYREFLDEGLLGAPDTGFSSTGARIYPDGTIRGKSDYGEYVKYPDCTLICTNTSTTIADLTISLDGVYYGTNIEFLHPVQFVSTPSSSVNMQSSGRLIDARANTNNTIKSAWYPTSNASRSSLTVISAYMAIGKWK